MNVDVNTLLSSDCRVALDELISPSISQNRLVLKTMSDETDLGLAAGSEFQGLGAVMWKALSLYALRLDLSTTSTPVEIMITNERS